MDNTITDDLVKAIRWNSTDFIGTVNYQKRNVILDWLGKRAKSSDEINESLEKLISISDEKSFSQFVFSPSLWQCFFTENYSSPRYSLGALLEDESAVRAARTSTNVESMNISASEEIVNNLVWDSCGRYAIKKSSKDHQIYTNSTVCEDTVVDTISPHTSGLLPEIPTASDDYSAEKVRLAVSKVDDAFTMINDICNIACDYVKDVCQVVALKNAEGEQAGFVSASTNICSGRPVLQNVHLDFVTVEKVADALVHELIHTLFDSSEFFDTKLPHKRSAVRITSPWTGNELDANTYIQACYVWFGLYNFWRKALEQGSYNNPEVKELFQKCSNGLVGKEFLRRAKAEGAGVYGVEIISALEFIADEL